MKIAHGHDAFDPFNAVHLTQAQARQAFPLARMLNPAIAMADWLGFTRRYTRLPADRGGIVAMMDKRGCIHAIFTYRVDQSIGIGRFLRISDIMIGHLPGVRPGQATLKSIRRLAIQLDCPSVVMEALTVEDADISAADSSAPFGYLHRPKLPRVANHH